MQRAVGRCETAVRNREGRFGAVSQERVDALASINEGGTAEDFKSFRPLLNSEETGAFLVSIRPLQNRWLLYLKSDSVWFRIGSRG